MKNQSGQTLIIIILALLVISLVVLAVASRSITDVGISTTSEDSARAFSAAEAGVEEAVEQIRANPLIVTFTDQKTLTNNAGLNYTITAQGQSNLAFLSPSDLNSDLDTFQVYLASRDNPVTSNYSADNICILWGKPDPGNNLPDPSIEATVIYRSGGVWTNQRFALNPSSQAGRGGFLTAVAGGCPTHPTQVLAANNNLEVDRSFQYAHQLDLTASNFNPDPDTNCGGGSTRCVALLRVRLLYTQSAAQYVGVVPQGAGVLPSQGYKIESTGTSGQTQRKVQVYQAFPYMPTVFDFALYNDSGAITK